MKVTLLCSDSCHPIYPYLQKWLTTVEASISIDLVETSDQALGGDILIMASCSEIISKKVRARYSSSLVLHASDLPRGRGWSPHIWELIKGSEFITLSLLEAEDKIDVGKIWKKVKISIPQDALWDEINHMLFLAEINLINFAIANYLTIKPQNQSTSTEPTYYERRTNKDSQIDPHKSIAEQFNLIRVCDPNRFPAYFEYLGQRYLLKIEKSNEQ